jgi:hypothetical protein
MRNNVDDCHLEKRGNVTKPTNERSNANDRGQCATSRQSAKAWIRNEKEIEARKDRVHALLCRARSRGRAVYVSEFLDADMADYGDGIRALRDAGCVIDVEFPWCQSRKLVRYRLVREPRMVGR